MAALIDINDIVTKERLVDTPLPSPVASPVSPAPPQIRVVFMGTPVLAQELLFSLLQADYNVVAVVTKPDTLIGRKQEEVASPVKKLALEHELPVLTPVKLDDNFHGELEALRPDLILVAAYGKILPKRILELPGLGCLNVHYSLLPRFRGASPIQHALLFGDTVTGVTLMKMDAGLDTGAIIATENQAIDPDDTAKTLTPKLNVIAQDLILKALPLWIKQKIQAAPQPQTGVVLCQLIERADGKVEWAQSAEEIYNRYRAFDPWPGIFTYWKKGDTFIRIKLLSISLLMSPMENHEYQLGEVFQLADVVAVQTGAGVIFINSVQPEGKGVIAIEDFIRGNTDFIGAFLV